MDAVKQVNSGEEAAIGLASVSLKRKAENAELSNSIESRDETPERGLEQVGRNDPSDVVSEGPTKKKGRFEPTETSTECSWNLDPTLTEYANKYMDNFVSNQTSVNEIMSFNPVPQNLKRRKILDPYLTELLTEQDKYICLNQDKPFGNLQQRIAFVYGHLTKIWTAMEAEKESYLADEGETNSQFELSKLFDQVILLLGQAMNSCSYIRRFNVLMSFVGNKKRVESMFKDNATAFSDAGNILFWPKYEELVAKSLSSKNRSKELFGSIKNQGSSQEGSRRPPFRKDSLFRSREIRGEEFSQLLVKSFNKIPYRRKRKGKNVFISSTSHQLDGPSVCISILQNTSTSSEFIPGKNQATAQSKQTETFCKELAKADKQSYDTGYSKGLPNPFYFAAKAIKATKFVSFNQRSVRPSGSGGPGHVEERCYSIFVSQKGPISHLFVFCEKERWRESPSSQPKGPEQIYSVSAIQDGRVVPIKGNVVTRGQNVQDRPEGCILCNPPVSEIQDVCQIPVGRPSIRVLLPLLWAFSSSSGFYKTIKSPYLSFEKAQCKNNN